MESTVLRLLRSLAARLKVPVSSSRAALALFKDAAKLVELCAKLSSPRQPAELESAMMDLAESLSHLNAALSKRRRLMADEFLDTTNGRVHLSSALITAEGCAHLAAAGVLARNNGFRLARSCLQLAICAGRAGLASAVAHAEAGFGDDADATILPGLILRVPETVTCSTVFIGRQPPPGVSEAAYLAMLCSTAVGQPAALEWLATVAKALLHKYSLHEEEASHGQSDSFVFLTSTFLVHWRQGVFDAASPEVLQPVADALLLVCLRVNVGRNFGRCSGAGGRDGLPRTLLLLLDRMPQMEQAAARCLHSRCGPAAAVFALALVWEEWSEEAEGEAAEHLTEGIALLGRLCDMLLWPDPAGNTPADLSGDPAACVYHGWNAAAWQITAALPSLSAHLRAVLRRADGGPIYGGHAGVVIRCLTAVAKLGQKAGSIARAEEAAVLLEAADSSVALLPPLWQARQRAQQAQQAGLAGQPGAAEEQQEQPAVAAPGGLEAGEAPRQQPSQPSADGLAHALASLVRPAADALLGWLGRLGRDAAVPPPAPWPVLAGLLRQVWGLHTRICRTQLWRMREGAWGGDPTLGVSLAHAQSALLDFADRLERAAADAGQHAFPEAGSAFAAASPIAAAHIATLHALLKAHCASQDAASGGSRGGSSSSGRGGNDSPARGEELGILTVVPTLLASHPADCWQAADAGFWRLVLCAMSQLDQRGAEALSSSGSLVKSALRLAGIAAEHRAAAAALVHGGLLPLLLQALGAAQREADTLEARECAIAFLDAAVALLTTFGEALHPLTQLRGGAATSITDCWAADSAELGQVAQDVDSIRGVAKQLREAQLSLRGGALPDTMLQVLQPLVPQLEEVAEAMCEFRRPAGQEAAEQLALARVAAARSCAHLACSNVDAEGGPAAGEGRGCKKCGGCRAVSYCSEACQHTDWRQGGHRRVCKLLAANPE